MNIRQLLTFVSMCFAGIGVAPLTHANEQGELAALYQTCLQCHARENNETSTASVGPNLHGQERNYLAKQLRDFKSGARGQHADDLTGMQMAAISQTIPDNLIDELANYLAAQEAVKAEAKSHGNLMNGERYYQAKCGACHGKSGEGNPAFYSANLQILGDDYIFRQMHKYQQDQRGTKPDDRLGRQMNMMSKTVTAEELKDIVFFIKQ